MSILSRKQTNVHKFQKKKRDLFLNTSNAASPKQRKRQGEKSIKIKCHMRKRLGDKDKIKIEVSGFINSHLHKSAAGAGKENEGYGKGLSSFLIPETTLHFLKELNGSVWILF